MAYYPHTLKRDWYTADVCDHIFASLEGAKFWTSYYENKYERRSYLETFEDCQKIAKKHDLKPKEMLQALGDYRDTLPLIPKPPFFSLARWIYNCFEARKRAVNIAINLVEGISNRYLP